LIKNPGFPRSEIIFNKLDFPVPELPPKRMLIPSLIFEKPVFPQELKLNNERTAAFFISQKPKIDGANENATLE